MKKLLFLIFLLTACFMLTTNAQFADVSKKDDSFEAVEALTRLSVVSGIEENGALYFKPEKTLTRAEAAKLVTLVCHADEAARGAGKRSVFSDVPADHWAADYIVYLKDTGAVCGMGDGLFAPEDTVLWEQLVKLLVASLGYAPQAEAMGGYPVGYTGVAYKIGLMKKCSAAWGEAIPRASAAQLCYNALDIPLMKPVGWNIDSPSYVVTGETSDYPEETLLTAAFSMKKINGCITETHLQRTPLDKEHPFVVLSDTKGDPIGEYRADEQEAAALLGYRVSAYLDDSENEENKLAFLFERKDNTVKTYPLCDVSSPKLTESHPTITVNTDTDKQTVRLSNKTIYYLNQDQVPAEEFWTAAGKNGTITFIYHDQKDSYVDTVLAKKYAAMLVIDENKQKLTFKNGALMIPSQDDEDAYVRYLTDRGESLFSDLLAGDTLCVSVNKAQTVWMIDVSEDALVGRVTAVKSDTVTVGGSTREVLSPLNISVGDEGVFYQDRFGKIIWYENKGRDSAAYGYLISLAVERNRLSGKVRLSAKMLDEDGFTQELSFAEKVTIRYGEERCTEEIADLLPHFKTRTGGLIRYFPAEDACRIAEGETPIVRFVLNEKGEISTLMIPYIDTVSKAYFSGKTIMGVEYDKIDSTLANMEVTQDTVIFTVTNGETLDEEAVRVQKGTQILTKKTPYFGYGYIGEGGDLSCYEALCLFTEEETPNDEAPFIVVEEPLYTTDAEGETVQGFFGYTDGKGDRRLFLLAEDCVLTDEYVTGVTQNGKKQESIQTLPLSWHDLQSGDVLTGLYAQDGTLTYITRLFSAKRLYDEKGQGFCFEGKDAIGEEITILFGFVAKEQKDKKEKKVFLLSETPVEEEDKITEIARVREAKMKGNIYLVDLTKEEINIDDEDDFSEVIPLNITVKNGKTQKGGYGYFIYAKMYEEEIVDAVIFKADCAPFL